MNITPINTTNSQPNFKGYVDPKLIDLIKISANGAMKKELKLGGFSSRLIDMDTHSEIRNISKKADEFIDILENSGIKELHPDTNITYANIESTKAIYIDRDIKIILTNPKIQQSLTIGTLIDYFNNKRIFQKECQFKPDCLNDIKLNQVFEMFRVFFYRAKGMFAPESLKDSERRMFVKFTDGGIRPFRHKKANKLAPEFGLPSNWTEVLRNKRLKERAERELAAKLREDNWQKQMLEKEMRRKQFEEQNMKIVEKYMK